jgi:hypothetical protein
MTEHRKILRVCAKYTRRIKKLGGKPFKAEKGLDLYDLAYALSVQLERLEA